MAQRTYQKEKIKLEGIIKQLQEGGQIRCMKHTTKLLGPHQKEYLKETKTVMKTYQEIARHFQYMIRYTYPVHIHFPQFGGLSLQFVFSYLPILYIIYPLNIYLLR